ncbi:MAG: transcriptional repressor [Chlorobiales bacterium]|nr:transcriptional repressor [Chlorobiales bacterium]
MNTSNQEKIGQRYSRQREEILKIVAGTKTHPTADWVYEEARRAIPNISLGTVYRNLNLLADEGVISRIILDDGKVRFDGNSEEHHHFICNDTGKVYDIQSSFSGELIDKLYRETGMKAANCKIEFFGNDKQGS